MDQILSALLDWVQSIDPVLRTAVAGVAMLLETSVLVGLIVPGDTIVLVAASATDSLLERILLALVIVAGALAGEIIGYFLGRWLGPHIRASWVGRKLGERNWNRAQAYLRRRGGPAVFLSRFLPVLHSLVPLTAGMSGFRLRRFLAWTIPACVIWAGLYVSVTSLAVDTYENLSKEIHGAGYIFVGIVVAFLLLVLIAKKLIERRERRHLSDEPDTDSDANAAADADAQNVKD